MNEPSRRPRFIRHVTQLPCRDVVWPESDEVLSVRTPLSRPLGLTRLGVHHELLPPGRRSSLPHAESDEEECVYVLEGRPSAWIDGELHALEPNDIVCFAPGTGIRHTIVNETAEPVRLLVIGERAAVARTRVEEFLAWLDHAHPEVDHPEDVASGELIQLVDEFEQGRVSRDRGLRESWLVAFVDHLGLRPHARPDD